MESTNTMSEAPGNQGHDPVPFLPMIKAVCFDFGGVLLRTRDRSYRHHWDDRFGWPHGTLEERVFNSPQGREAQLGRFSAETHWQQLNADWGLSPAELARLRADFPAGDALDDSLIAALRRMRRHVRLALISNAFDSLREELHTRWPIAELFDVIVVSAEIGTMKPDPAIYHHALQLLALPPHQTVFIDDFAHNIAGARAIGMHAIHYPPHHDATHLGGVLSGEYGV
jgi:putative hydrolase of the HAD superfamily